MNGEVGGSACRESGGNHAASCWSAVTGGVAAARKAVGISPPRAGSGGERLAGKLSTMETVALVFTAPPFSLPLVRRRTCCHCHHFAGLPALLGAVGCRDGLSRNGTANMVAVLGGRLRVGNTVGSGGE
jgi:hypothetical protein